MESTTQKSFMTTLSDKAGNALRLRGKQLITGRWTTAARHRLVGADGTVESRRGATRYHETREEAEAAFEELLATALAAGWQQRRGGGHTEDAFTLEGLPTAVEK
jgi:hypothetical protein